MPVWNPDINDCWAQSLSDEIKGKGVNGDSKSSSSWLDRTSGNDAIYRYILYLNIG